MKVLYDVKEKSIPTLVLGFFDGIHTAHRKIIEHAKCFNLQTAIITFTKSPLEYLENKSEGKPVNYLTTNDERIEILSELGVDYVYMLDFEKIMHLSAEEYLKNVLIKNFKPKNIVTGFNHRFGKKGSGDAEFLHKHQNDFGYTYTEIPPIEINGELVSSTNIRNLISKGDFENANILLGRTFSIGGKVLYGSCLGRTIGFPTVNTTWQSGIVEPPYGVYEGTLVFNNTTYKAIINWGTRANINPDNRPTLEAHIINFKDDLYEKEVCIFFERKIRDEISFSNIEELKNQINKDIQAIT